MDDFITRALLGGIGVALLCAPLGCLVVWQRMAYFGATLAHAALLGVAFGIFFHINLQLAILLVSFIVSLLFAFSGKHTRISSDTLLGIIAHAALALGLVLLALLPRGRLNLLSYLFGDILAISQTDLLWIYLGGALTLLILAKIWRPLLSLITQRELALVDGINERATRAIFLALLSLLVAVAMQVIGVLLIVSLLIIPPATARYCARSPEMMAALAALFGVLAVSGGLGVSLLIDTPTAPSIVVIASLLLVAIALTARLLQNRDD